MSDDQNTEKSEQKPKATLIKHRKDDEATSPQDKTSSDSRKRVVKKKVVIKKKVHTDHEEREGQAKPVKRDTEASQERGEETKTPPKEAKSASSQPSSGSQTKPNPEKAPRKTTPDAKPGENRPRAAGPRQAGNLARKQGNLAGRDTSSGKRSYPTKAGIVGGRYVGPDRNSGPGRGQQGGPGGPGGDRNRPPRPPQRNFRPGGPGGRPGSTPPPPDAAPEEKKASSKKFFKAKKKDNFQKRDRHQEKEIHFKSKKPKIKTNPVPKEVSIMEVITVSELAKKMNLKASDLIAKLMAMGMMVTINQQIDADTAQILAAEYDCKVNIVSLYDETLIESPKDTEADLEHRPPIVTVMGHVDHGKTKLLDAIRKTNVVNDEAGGITQHIGAYQVETSRGKVTFIDTPGHEAFTLMRARGAQVTDIVILVVAANDGVMPQTLEAISHAKDAKVPIIIAINKVDLPEANIDRVKQQLADRGLLTEDWGGDVMSCPISALKGEGINELLDAVLLQAEVMELKANYKGVAEGKVIESRIDQGRGTVSTVLIERGCLKVGDSFVAGVYPGKVRAMFNDRGQKVDEAGPSMPVEILGFTGIPEAGVPFQVTESDRMARQVGEKRQELQKVENAKNVKKITLDNLYDSIQQGEIQELKVIIKGDVHGSVEAIQSALEKLSTQEIHLVVVQAAAGAINERDIMLAAASNAIIIGFHVRPTPKAQAFADQEKVEIRKYSIIYDVVEDIRQAMEGMLSPELREEQIGTVEVRETFKVPKQGVIAGSYVTNGEVRRNAQVHLIRDGIEIFTGPIVSLRRFKDDAKEVKAGFECGIGLENWIDIQTGDTMEVFVMKEVAKKLGPTLEEIKKSSEKKKK
ncbi:translation initiation factor IF-2 [Spirochaeta lutea]|uniref:Translation initiation factor IF-2 n=1 Tax=Spirochaeta lutea TaxID=1480694 RepID=A0A098R1G8_9SPIO|nr:translation initiation factor IF-2 [Spirochaeta lutea]KGE73975.1 translation initiation factor IF-2 [Spirochaeta lutea]